MISILIPVHNVEQYLARCLDSILCQNLTQWECLLLDDGSTDGSGHLCDDYASRDPRFRTIHQPNAGVAAVRNRLIEEAHGEWLAFIDADDWIDPNYLETLASLQQQTQADIVSCGHIKHFANFTRETRETFSGTGPEACLLIIQDRLSHFLWSRLIRRSLLIDNNIRCVPNQNAGEDLVLLTLATLHAQKVVHSPELIYHYNRANEQSYCYHFSPSIIRQLCANHLYIREEIREKSEEFFQNPSPLVGAGRVPARAAERCNNGMTPQDSSLLTSSTPQDSSLFSLLSSLSYASYCSRSLLRAAFFGDPDLARELRSNLMALPPDIRARLPRTHRLALHIRPFSLLRLYARLCSRLHL